MKERLALARENTLDYWDESTRLRKAVIVLVALFAILSLVASSVFLARALTGSGSDGDSANAGKTVGHTAASEGLVAQKGEVGAIVDAKFKKCLRSGNTWTANVTMKNPTTDNVRYRVVASITDKNGRLLTKREGQENASAKGEAKVTISQDYKGGNRCVIAAYRKKA